MIRPKHVETQLVGISGPAIDSGDWRLHEELQQAQFLPGELVAIVRLADYEELLAAAQSSEEWREAAVGATERWAAVAAGRG